MSVSHMPAPQAADRIVAPLFLAALAFTLFMALDPLPPHLPIDPLGDKAEHMLAFFTLTTLARIGFPRVAPLRLAEHLSFLGALIEVAQASPHINRDCDWKDWVADTLAILLALAVNRWVVAPLNARAARGR